MEGNMTKASLILILIFSLAAPTYSQFICDANGSGHFTGADISFLIIILRGLADNPDMCDIDCDLDHDSLPFTVSDIMWVFYFLDRDDPNFHRPDFPFNPELDTLVIESAHASPGDTLYLPVYLKTIDTLSAFQLYIVADTNYVKLDSMIRDPGFQFVHVSDSRYLRVIEFSSGLFAEPILLYPGEYHLGDLEVIVNPDISQPVATQIRFSGCPEDNYYTGFGNIIFFEPVLIDAEITITPTGIESEIKEHLPFGMSIEAYPNPFNSSVTISVESPAKSRLAIYDILGREVREFLVNEGSRKINWDGSDSKGEPVGSGIYFARLASPENSKTIRMLLLR
jgi:hypothetical protein